MLTGDFSQFVNGVSARVNEIIDETRDLGPSFMKYGLWSKENNTEDLIYRTNGVTGLGYLEKFDENDGIKKDRTYPAYGTEYVMQQYGKIVEVSQLLMKTRPSELEKKLSEVKQLMITANRTLNRHAWQVLVDAFESSDTVSGLPVSRLSDAVAMISASHPSLVPGVSVRSNIVSGNPVLNGGNLFSAQKLIEEQLNGRSLPINYEGRYALIVPPALKKTAYELLKSELSANSTDNNINFFKGVAWDLIVTTYLGSSVNSNSYADTNWIVVALDAGENQASMRYVPLIEPKIEQTVDFDTKTIRISVDAAWAFGYSNFEFVAGSKGNLA